ncbi:AraC family transcriptional regulator [Ruminococcus sp.]|uniref:helix-turn-helix transcriptional regulator n=1 Tax=Ruminococcus sp. TaxID=41978 RepID=UPI0025E4E90C|nr:AraC family transcriptional regulator [Ruminococcus sp.]MCR4638068.1 AraC family transcriptional regulator [Ruminococcus sp.]
MKQTPTSHKTTEPTPAEQQLAKSTFSFCMEHKQEHFTISFLAARAGVSPTKLKLAYRRIYAAPLFAHIRKEKMLWAAHELEITNLRVIDIAEACGYDNASKFSAAFCSVLDCTPTEYRRVRLE